MERSKRKARPSMDGLEGRMLLSGKGHAVQAQSAPVINSQLDYTTADGAKVHLQLTGGGSLAGSTVVDGILNLTFSGTTVFTTISGTVKGGSGQAPLGTLAPSGVAVNSQTGLGGDLIGRVLLPSFNLISGGEVNLLSGVQTFTLNSVAANSQVHLRDTPLNTSLGVPSYVNTVTGAGESYARISSSSTGATSSSASGLSSGTSIGAASGSSSSGLTVVGSGTLNPVALGFGGGSVGAINGAIPIINTVGNGQNYLGSPGLTQATVSAGRLTSYITDATGGEALSTITGSFVPGANLIEPSDYSLPGGRRVPPPGVIATINHINGGSTLQSPPLGDAQVFGYDATANRLIRFDAVTGAQTLVIPVPASTTGVGGVDLTMVGGRLLALVGIGQGVYAYDATTGAPAGGFSASDLAGQGFTTITGLTTGGGSTVLVDANDRANGPNGTIQSINLAQSLAFGQVVTAGSPFSPINEFSLSGGVASVPGTGSIYALGGAYFNTSLPNLTLAGVLAIKPATAALTESARTAISIEGNSAITNANGAIVGNPSRAIGSIDSTLAVVTGVSGGVNQVSLLYPSSLGTAGSVALVDANPLAGLSQSYHPEITNSALVDVQGNLQSFTAQTANNLVLNDAGNLDLLTIGQASNSSIVALPISHVNIASRANVTILTSNRLVGTRGGVIVNPSAREIGPLSLP